MGSSNGRVPQSPLCSPVGSCSTSPAKAGVFAMLASSVALPPAGAVAGAVDAVVGRASSYLPTSLGRRRSSSTGPPQPAPVNVPVRLLNREEAVLGATLDTSLVQLQHDCFKRCGIPPERQRICIQEEPREAGLSGLLRTTATNLSSRQRMARQLADWSSFLLLPEGVNRELRGQGLVTFLHDNVWQQLRDQPPPPGTARVLVATLDGRRRCMLVRSSSSIAAVRQEVQLVAAIPADQQRLVVFEQPALNAAQRVAWAVLRLLLALLLWLGGWLLAGARLALGLPPPTDVRLQLLTASGREVQLAVSPDTTLQQLQRMVWEQHGEELSLQQLLSVSPSKAGSSSPEQRSSSSGVLPLPAG